MTLEDEKALLARFAKAAGAGEMLNIHDLKAAYEKAIGHETSKARSIISGPAQLSQADRVPPQAHIAQDAFKKMAFQML